MSSWPTVRPPLPQPAHPLRQRTLGFLLREVYGLLQDRIYASVAAAGHPGLRAAHSPVLRHLPPDGGRVSELARATGLAKQSIAYVVQDLIALGYLCTQPDPDDGRARQVVYTPLGRKLLAALIQASREAEDAMAATLGAAQLQALRAMLETMLDPRSARGGSVSNGRRESPTPPGPRRRQSQSD